MNSKLLGKKLLSLSQRVEPYKQHLTTEEATKTSIILPFIQEILGYDVFNPKEVLPEYNADIGVKKGEKVDYAIFGPEGIRMLVECKSLPTNLSAEHVSQLFRYFSASTAKVAVLTNGKEFRFFTDSEKENLLDSTPFLVFNLDSPTEEDIDTLLSLTNSSYSFESIFSTLSLNRYQEKLRDIIETIFANTPDEWVGAFVAEVYDGPNTFKIRQEFQPIVMQALNAFLEAQIEEAKKPEENPIVTTPDEMAGYGIVQDMLMDIVPPSKVRFRDTRSYFGVYLDDGTKFGKMIVMLYITDGSRYALEIRKRDGSLEFTNVGSLEGIQTKREDIRDRLNEILENDQVKKAVFGK